MNWPIERWFRASALVRVLYQGAPIVALHRLLKTIGQYVALGKELSQLARIDRTVPPLSTSAHRQRVLFMIPRNFRTHATFQACLAQALSLRGAECAIATCGGIMPVCEVAWPEQEIFPRCARCTVYVTELADLAGIPRYRLSDYRNQTAETKVEAELSALDIHAMATYIWNDLPIGKFAVASARWRLRSHEYASHPMGRSVLHALIRGGVRWAFAVEELFRHFRPDVIVMLNGLFVEERVTWAVAERHGYRCVFFEKGRDAGTVFLSHGTSAPRYDITDTWEKVSSVPLSSVEHQRIVDVLNRRARGEQMVETYWAEKQSDEAKIRAQLGLASDRPLAVLFSNVVWDTAMQDRDTIFSGMFDWIAETVQLFAEHPEWNLVVRIHPAETQVPGRESYDRVADWIGDKLTSIPDNVRIVMPEEAIDSYSLMRMASVGCVYASTVGLEMAATGVPVVVAGNAHYSHRGFTCDPVDRMHYRRCITDAMTGRLSSSSDQNRELALRYAHVFFLRRMYPMTVLMEPAEARPTLAYSSLRDLAPGQKPILDLICEGILHGTPFERNPDACAFHPKHD